VADAFADAARRLAAAGFDLIQIHGDHLLGALASSQVNCRSDAFGGNLEQRLGLACQIIERVRTAAPDLVIDYKLPVIPAADPGPASGTSLDELGRAVPWLEQAGVDCWHVCRSASHAKLETAIPTSGDEACFAALGQAVKQVARNPVAVVGRIRDPAVAARLVESGQCDLVALGRQLIADPDWPRKVRSQQLGAIARCDLCNRGCVTALTAMRPIACCVQRPHDS
jgi:2,4-dienoyl-CoA reductase-like NADH-dependent reductase (Old Yellow Enzyme family)